MLAKVYIAECHLGKGIFATCDLKAGEEMFTCTGRMISRAEVIDKGDDISPNPIQIEKTRYMDVEAPALFINHACIPNAGLVDNIQMVALRNIRMHEEICLDYSTTMSEEYWTMQCQCGSPFCRGEIRDFKYLPMDLKTYYLALGIVQDFIVQECRQEMSTETWTQINELQISLRLQNEQLSKAA